MLKRVQSGREGFYFTENIFQTVSLTETVNEQGEKVLQKGFINATMLDGSEIDPEKIYTGCTNDFLINGGYDFARVIGPTDEIDPSTGEPYVPLDITNIQ